MRAMCAGLLGLVAADLDPTRDRELPLGLKDHLCGCHEDLRATRPHRTRAALAPGRQGPGARQGALAALGRLPPAGL